MAKIESLIENLNHGGHEFIRQPGNASLKKGMRAIFQPSEGEQSICAEELEKGEAGVPCANIEAIVFSTKSIKGRHRDSNKRMDDMRKVVCMTQRACPIFEHAGNKRSQLPCTKKKQELEKALGKE